MALTAVDKIKINKYLKEHAIDDLYYTELCESLGKKDKVTYVEFIEHFTECVINEFNKNEKISINYLSKVILLIECLITGVKKTGSTIKEETIQKIISFKEFYAEYLKRNELEIEQEFNDTYIKTVVKMANKLITAESKKETIIKYINRIKELEDELKLVKKQLEETTKNYDKLAKDNGKQTKKIDVLTSDITSMEKECNIKTEETNRLSKKIETLTNQLEELEKELNETKLENEELNNFKKQYEKLTLELDELKKVIEEINKEKQLEKTKKLRTKEIESLIYKKILLEGLTIDEIITYLKKEGYTSSKEEISNILKNIKTRISIINNTFSLSPVYKVNVPNLIDNNQFMINIPENCKYYDIMLVSDFHIRSIDSKVLNGFNMLNEYCIKNNINLILNLGDFYDGWGNKVLEYSNAVKNYNLIEDSITLLPKADHIYHAILGGNHDRNIANYGYDPIRILTSEREDFINLGYNHSTIYLNDNNNTQGMFSLHHPNSFEFTISLDENGINSEGLEIYLDKIYRKQGKIRENSYIDILGHTHKSQFNYEKSYCYIPSYFESQLKRGACHLRIYFDENKEIKYMIFMPLSVTNQLIKNNEIIYKKILTK